jgi:hypothetical protein
MKRLLSASLLLLTGCNLLKNPLIGPLKFKPVLHDSDTIWLLIAGQSNGTSPAQWGATDAYSMTGMVQVTLPNDPYTLVTPTKENPVHTSVSWVYLGDAIALSTRKRVNIINVAAANSSTARWRNSLYLRAIIALQKFPIDAVIWVQGESDYGENVPTEDGFNNLKFVIEQCNGHRYAPWYVALDTVPTEPGKPYLGTEERVLSAQRMIISKGYANRGPDLMPLHYEAHSRDSNGAEFLGDDELHEHANLWFDVLNRSRPWQD